jgi:hypothetical protein
MEAPTTPTANKPRAVNALSIFRRTHGAAITESANAKLSASQATENPIPHNISAHENEEVADFNSWAAQILSGEIPFDAEATRSLIRGTANDDTAPVPVLEVHEAGGVHMPTLDVDNTSVDVLRRLLQEYAAETTGGRRSARVTLQLLTPMNRFPREEHHSRDSGPPENRPRGR